MIRFQMYKIQNQPKRGWTANCIVSGGSGAIQGAGEPAGEGEKPAGEGEEGTFDCSQLSGRH